MSLSGVPFLADPTQHNGTAYAPAVANDVATLQTAIVARLVQYQANGAAPLQGVEIAAFPDQPENWRLTNQVGAVLVRFESSEYGPVEDTLLVVQQRSLKFMVGIAARGLSWADAGGYGAMPIMEACRNALIGWKIPGCQKIHAVEDSFVRRDMQGGVWYFALIIQFHTWIQENPDAWSLPAFTQGQANVSATIGTNGTPIDTVIANSSSGPEEA